MLIADKYARAEITVKKSRFIAEIFPIDADDSAKAQTIVRAVIKSVKKDNPAAAHVVHAFILGAGAEILGCSDDGEPPGTAGRPALDVLKGAGLTYTAATVTRYFGGVLLGTGGLVKAYGDAVKAALKSLCAREIIPYKYFACVIPYEKYAPFKRAALENRAVFISEDFAESVSVKAKAPSDRYDALKRAAADITCGSAVFADN